MKFAASPLGWRLKRSRSKKEARTIKATVPNASARLTGCRGSCKSYSAIDLLSQAPVSLIKKTDGSLRLVCDEHSVKRSTVSTVPSTSACWTRLSSSPNSWAGYPQDGNHPLWTAPISSYGVWLNQSTCTIHAVVLRLFRILRRCVIIQKVM